MDEYSRELATGQPPENAEGMPIYRLPVGKQLDPLKYRRKVYVLNVDVSSQPDGTGANSLSIDDMPFMWTKTTVAIKDIDASAQDFNFVQRIRDSNRYYQSDFCRADIHYGNPITGVVIPFDVATFLDANATISAEVINGPVLREGEIFTVQFLLHGFERWRK